MSRPVLLFSLALVVGPLLTAAGQDARKAFEDIARDLEMARSGFPETTFRRTPDGWIQKTVYKKHIDLGELPAKEVLNSMTVKWDSAKLDELGNRCSMGGRLFVKKNGREQPIDWKQGLSVYLCKKPNTKLDWSRGISTANTVAQTTSTDKTGKFVVEFDMRYKKVDCGNDGGRFQVGLALAVRTKDKEGTRTVFWSSKQRAKSVVELTIPKAPSLPKEMRLINESRLWPIHDRDCAKLVRAVNTLQPLGKTKALAVLEKYLALAEKEKVVKKKRPDCDIVLYISLVLFEPIELGRSYRNRKDEHEHSILKRKTTVDDSWPMNPLVLVDEIPFMLCEEIDDSYRPGRPDRFLDYVTAFCVMRDKPLRPTSDPFAAANSLLNCKKFGELEDDVKNVARDLIQSQAAETAKDFVGQVIETDDGSGETALNAAWDNKVRHAKRLDIKWNDAKSRFDMRIKR